MLGKLEEELLVLCCHLLNDLGALISFKELLDEVFMVVLNLLVAKDLQTAL